MASEPFPQTFSGLGHSHAQSIEDFEAQMAAAKQLPAPDSDSQSFSTPPPSSNPPPFNAGRLWSSESVATFNNLCLKNAIANVFDYTEVPRTPPGWAVVLNFGFNTLDADGETFTINLPGPYSSKKEAKAAAAEEGLKILTEAIEKNGGSINKRKKPTTTTSSDTKDGAADSSDDENTNWVGLIGEYCQAENKPRPMFQEFSLGANYSMECTIADRPAEPFGGRTVLFNSKRNAKANAARAAVRWLRDTGHMPKKGHPTKRRARDAKLAAAAPDAAPTPSPLFAPTDHGPLPLPTPIGGGDAATTAATTTTSSDSDGNASPSSPSQADRSLGEQVMSKLSPLPSPHIPSTPKGFNRKQKDLCHKLGCAQPIYRITPDPRVPSMWSGAAYFTHDPAIAPPGQSVGEVRNIYGKKKAREEVAKKLLKHLRAKRAERQREVDVVGGPA